MKFLYVADTKKDSFQCRSQNLAFKMIWCPKGEAGESPWVAGLGSSGVGVTLVNETPWYDQLNNSAIRNCYNICKVDVMTFFFMYPEYLQSELSLAISIATQSSY